MPANALETLKPTLAAIPSADVMAPNRPVDEASAHAHQIAKALRNGELGSDLTKLRLPADAADQIERAAMALAFAQADYKRPVAREVVTQGSDIWTESEAVFQDLRATVLFLSDGNRAVRRSLAEASGDASDRTSAFFQLAVAFEVIKPLVGPEDNFDVDAAVATCRDWGQRLLKANAERDRQGDVGARDLRDRAFTHVDDLLDRVRAAAQFFHRPNRQKAARFMEFR